ncbi:hypothetical protein MLD38_040264 [Melastoma candidum]|uniref:Uncharacterized protein n=1 Tax=Melastoma candidum TaxID=119954 RepID=A0ACB9L4N4_9MYRT|nr:hypothetical protein MLD38_040264 [Melastoma candidum]
MSCGPPDHLPHMDDSSDDDDEEKEEMSRFDIWSSIRRYKMAMKEEEEEEGEEGRDPWSGEFGIWGSVELWKRSQWSETETAFVPPPYVHPLTRRSSSCLSEKSLEICTESLGSESGSDILSLSLMSETGSDFGFNDKKDGRSNRSLPAASCRTDIEPDFTDKPPSHAQAAVPRIKELARSFPPPLTSLSSANDGASVQMQPHRENGRLIIEAVYVPCHKNFRARRENGRLMLAFTAPDTGHCDNNAECDHSTELKEVVDILECEDYAEEEGIELKIGGKTESNAEPEAGSPNMDCIGIHKIPKIAILTNKPDAGSEAGQNKLWQSLPRKARSRADHSFDANRTSNPRTATSKAVANPSGTTQWLPPLPVKSYQETRKHLTSQDDRKKSMEDCWVSVMKDGRRRSLFFPDATFHCHVMT